MAPYKLTSTVQYIKAKYGDEILGFAHMSSNKLSVRDLEVLDQLFEASDPATDFDEEAFWASILSQEVPNPTQEPEDVLKKRRNRLLKAIERYLAFKEFEAVRPISDYLIARHYSENNNEKHARAILRRMEKNLEQGAYWSSELEVLYYWFFHLKIHLYKNDETIPHLISQLENKLEHFYQVNQMRILLAKVDNSQRLGLKKEDLVGFLEKSAEIINQPSSSRIIRLSGDLLNMLLIADDPSYWHAREVFEELVKNDPKFSDSFKKEITEILMNHCIRKTNSGEEEYAKHYIHHFNEMERMGQILEVNGKIGFQRLKNGLVVSLVAQDYGWFHRMRKKYGKNIHEELSDEKENPLLSFLIATYELHRTNGNINKGMTALNVFKNSKHYRKNPIHKVSVDKLMIKFFFQKKQFRSFENGIASLETYIRRKKSLTNRYKDAQLGALKYFKKNATIQSITISKGFESLPIPDRIWIKNVNEKRPPQNEEA